MIYNNTVLRVRKLRLFIFSSLTNSDNLEGWLRIKTKKKFLTIKFVSVSFFDLYIFVIVFIVLISFFLHVICFIVIVTGRVTEKN